MPGDERVDPHAGPPDSASVNPARAPPRAPRRPWLPFLVVALVACLPATGFYVADHYGEQGFGRRAQAFVPVDGTVIHTRRHIRTAGSTEAAPTVTESARFTGPAIFTALDFTFGSQLLGTLDDKSPVGVPFWRTTTTEVGTPTSSQQLVRVYRVAGAVELIGESGPGVTKRLPPGAGRTTGGRRAGEHMVRLGLGGGNTGLSRGVPGRRRGRCGGACE